MFIFHRVVNNNVYMKVRQMPSFGFRGLPVHYLRQGSGEPLLLLHNGGTSHAIWKGVLPRLVDVYEVFALDLPGFGASPCPGTGYRLQDFVELLETFVAAFRLAPMRIAGNCMGSAMALGLAMRDPRVVHSLVLVNPLTDATFAAGWLGATSRLHQQVPSLSRALGRVTLPAFAGEQALAFQFGSTGRRQGLQRTPELQACFTRRGQMAALLSVLDDVPGYAQFDDFAPAAGFPRLCTIWGLENRVLSAEAGRRLNDTLRPQRQEWLPGCGHLAMLEQPGRVAGIMREFFADAA